MGHHATPISFGYSYHNESANFTKCFLVLIFELLKFREDSMQHEKQMCTFKKKELIVTYAENWGWCPWGGNWDHHRAYLNIKLPL